MPFGLELLLCVALALIFYGALIYKRFFPVLSGSGQSLPPDYSQSLANNFLDFINHLPFTDNLASAVTWSVAGVSFYILTIAVINALISLKNALTALNESKSTSGKIVSVSYEIRRSLWILLTLIYSYFYIKLLYSLLVQFGGGLDNWWWLHVMTGFIILSAANYMLYVLINLVRVSPALVSLGR